MADQSPTASAVPARPRLALLDAFRGIALLAMVVYHLAWDLSYYGYYGTDLTADPAWVVFQRSILSSFLLLVGVGLVLGHGSGVRWPRFWRRLGILLAAALAVTLGTYWMFPDYFVYFGILHAIALFSLLGLPFVRLDLRLVLAAAGVILVLPAFFSTPLFDPKPLAWIGFWTTPPATTDMVSVFPWFGVVLLGIAGARLMLASKLPARLARWQASGPIARGLIICGRWSLLIYLLHQPILLGTIGLVSQLQNPVLQPEVLSSRAQGFAGSCSAGCAANGGAAGYCEAYCACALEQVESGDLWALVDNPEAARDPAIAAVTRLCAAMAD